MTTHITLLGDSIFDNKRYVGKGRSVIQHLRQLKPKEWKASLCAVDGHITGHIYQQVQTVPADTSHVFLSVGGNNALAQMDVLNQSVHHSSQVFDDIAAIGEHFETEYYGALMNVYKLDVPVTVCTIYYPRFQNDFYQRLAVAALSTFNDAIIKQASLFKFPIIDLRRLCNEPTDYANDIEPSSKGGHKIAKKILEVTKEHDFSREQTVIY